jgi:hypothetical protein
MAQNYSKKKKLFLGNKKESYITTNDKGEIEIVTETGGKTNIGNDGITHSSSGGVAAPVGGGGGLNEVEETIESGYVLKKVGGSDVANAAFPDVQYFGGLFYSNQNAQIHPGYSSWGDDYVFLVISSTSNDVDLTTNLKANPKSPDFRFSNYSSSFASGFPGVQVTFPKNLIPVHPDLDPDRNAVANLFNGKTWVADEVFDNAPPGIDGTIWDNPNNAGTFNGLKFKLTSSQKTIMQFAMNQIQPSSFGQNHAVAPWAADLGYSESHFGNGQFADLGSATGVMDGPIDITISAPTKVKVGVDGKTHDPKDQVVIALDAGNADEDWKAYYPNPSARAEGDAPAFIFQMGQTSIAAPYPAFKPYAGISDNSATNAHLIKDLQHGDVIEKVVTKSSNSGSYKQRTYYGPWIVRKEDSSGRVIIEANNFRNNAIASATPSSATTKPSLKALEGFGMSFWFDFGQDFNSTDIPDPSSGDTIELYVAENQKNAVVNISGHAYLGRKNKTIPVATYQGGINSFSSLDCSEFGVFDVEFSADHTMVLENMKEGQSVVIHAKDLMADPNNFFYAAIAFKSNDQDTSSPGNTSGRPRFLRVEPSTYDPNNYYNSSEFGNLIFVTKFKDAGLPHSNDPAVYYWYSKKVSTGFISDGIS